MFSTDLPASVADAPADALADAPSEEAPGEATVTSILEAFSEHAYQQGYARATRDLLAVYPLLIEQYLHRNQIESAELRGAIRGFGRFIEQTIDHRLSDSGYVDDGSAEGGLGI